MNKTYCETQPKECGKTCDCSKLKTNQDNAKHRNKKEKKSRPAA